MRLARRCLNYATLMSLDNYRKILWRMINDDLCEEVKLVRQKLHGENKGGFVDKERVRYYEDNLICTLLDPRFKLINFNESTVEMKKDAELYFIENYKADRSPK